MSKPIIQIENLSRYFQQQCAVNAVSFELAAGEVLGFLGPNGAGKTTTMQMITGNLAPTGGQVRINGLDIIDDPIEARQQIGYLPENPPVYSELTVIEYLNYCSKLKRIKKTERASAIKTVSELCGLGDVQKRLIGNLSKGFQQRVGIAQAIIHKPPVVILDEPTVGLDPIQIREIRSLIRSLGETCSVILSTHILSEVQSTCDRVQIIRKGSLVYHSSIEDLLKQQRESLQVAFDNPPSDTELTSLDGISSIEHIDDNRRRLYFDLASPATKLVELSVTSNWGLFELIPDKTSLEDLFIDIAGTEEPDFDEPAENEVA